MKENRLSIVSILLTVIYVFSTQSALAVPAFPEPITVAQPDGTRIEVLQKGDEWQNWTETMQGFTIAKDPKTKKWLYVDHYKGKSPLFTQTDADKTAPGHLKKSQRPERKPKRPKSDSKNEPLKTSSDDDSAASSAAEVPWGPLGPTSGNVVFLLAEFTDKTGTYGESTWGDFVNNNIADYYNTASYGNVTIQPANESSGIANNGVIGWLPLGYPHPDTYGDIDARNQQLTKDAIIEADSFIDYAAYDLNGDGYVDSNELSVVVIIAGYESAYSGHYPSVWGHQWSIWEIDPPVVDGVIVGDYHSGAGGYAQFGEIHADHQATMGIMVHELGHLMFGFPDLYDYDRSSAGIGYLCVMSGGTWGKSSTDQYEGQTPVLPSAWLKHAWGWVNSDNSLGLKSITAAGDSTAGSENTVVKIETGVDTEYFLIENRQDVGYDRGLEWEPDYWPNFWGLAIYHVDESQPNNDDDAHRLVSVEDARGMDLGAYNDYPNRLWYAGNPDSYDATFGPCTNPNSNLYDTTVTQTAVTNISALGTVMTADIGVDTEACEFITFASWNFESGIPDGWTTVTNQGDSSWKMNPDWRNNYTGGSGDFLFGDGSEYTPDPEDPSTWFDGEVRTQFMDLSSAAGTKLRFLSSTFLPESVYYGYPDGSFAIYEPDATTDIDVSTDGGNSWTNVWRVSDYNENYPEPELEEIDLSTFDGEPSVMIRFRIYNALLATWSIDNVAVLLQNPALVPVCRDLDGDGVANCDGDCHDKNPSIFPGAPELCDGLDNNCDGNVPENEVDADNDGFIGCQECNDNDPNVYPGAAEVCNNGIDDDCNGSADCEDGSCIDFCAQPQPEICYDGIDNDWDGKTDCADKRDCGKDPVCNVTDPGDQEICNDGIDNDGDGKTDCADKKDCGKDPVCK